MGVTEGKLERFRNEWNTREIESTEKKIPNIMKIKVTEKVKIIRTT